jgi:hypothetical protein
MQVTAFDPLGESDLLLRCEQPHLADVLQEQLKRIGRHLRLEIRRRLAAVALRGGALDVEARRGWVDLLDQLDLAALQQAVQLLDVGFLEADLGRGGRDLGVREHAHLQPARDQTPDLFKLVKIRSRHLVAPRVQPAPLTRAHAGPWPADQGERRTLL